MVQLIGFLVKQPDAFSALSYNWRNLFRAFIFISYAIEQQELIFSSFVLKLIPIIACEMTVDERQLTLFKRI